MARYNPATPNVYPINHLPHEADCHQHEFSHSAKESGKDKGGVMASSSNWTREQTLAAFHFYLGEQFGRLHSKNPGIIRLAQALGRTPGAVAMKACNLASLDPSLDRKGLSNSAGQERTIWKEFAEDPTAVMGQAREAYAAVMTAAPPHAETEETANALEEPENIGDANGGPTETTVTRKVRLTQSLFRRAVLTAYQHSCALTGLNEPTLLVASHIIPWSQDEKRRSDPRNGLALSALHDRAFDRGLLSFDAEYRMVLSNQLRSGSRGNAMAEASFLRLEGVRLRLPERFLPDAEAMAWHREMVFKKNEAAKTPCNGTSC